MIGRWVSHVIIYVSVCSALSLVWVVIGDGTVDELQEYAKAPADALTNEFWPIWAWLIWGALVVAHAGTVIGGLLRPKRWRRAIRSLSGAPDPRSAHDESGDRSRHNRPPGPRASSSRSGRRSRPRRRFVAAMFTDMSDSTELTAALGDAAWVEIVAAHRRVVRTTMAEFEGTEVATQGDGFFVRFNHPDLAARCAVEIQRRLAEERTADPRLPPVRIGIHVGDAIQATDNDVLGNVVNVAARLLDVAEPGEIIVTESVADHVDPGLLIDHGLAELKGIERPRHVLGVKWS